MPVRALPTLRFTHPEVQKAYDAIRGAVQEGNGERGDPNNRWLTVGDAAGGTLVKIFKVIDGATNTVVDLQTYIGDTVWNQLAKASQLILDDPFWKELAQTIDTNNPPKTLPGTVYGVAKALWDMVDQRVGLTGSAIAEISMSGGYCSKDGAITTDTTQASCEANGGNWTAGNMALHAVQMKAAQDGMSSTLSNLLSATPTSASWWTQLSTTDGTHTAGISQLGQTLYAAGTGLTAQYSVKATVNGKLTGFGLATDSTGGSRFYIQADRFAIAPADIDVTDPGTDALVPFSVVGGQVNIKSAVIGAASIGSLQVQGNSMTSTGYQEWAPVVTIPHTGTTTAAWTSSGLAKTYAVAPQGVLLLCVVQAGGVGGVDTNVGVRILRDGVVIADRTFSQSGGFTSSYTMTFMDTPSAGAHNYQLAVYNNWTAGSWRLDFISLSAFASLR